MLPTPQNQAELVASAHERARRLCETLTRQEDDFAVSQTPLEASVREAGLAVLRRAMQCATRLATHTQRLTQPPVATKKPLAEAPIDE